MSKLNMCQLATVTAGGSALVIYWFGLPHLFIYLACSKYNDQNARKYKLLEQIGDRSDHF